MIRSIRRRRRGRASQKPDLMEALSYLSMVQVAICSLLLVSSLGMKLTGGPMWQRLHESYTAAQSVTVAQLLEDGGALGDAVEATISFLFDKPSEQGRESDQAASSSEPEGADTSDPAPLDSAVFGSGTSQLSLGSEPEVSLEASGSDLSASLSAAGNTLASLSIDAAGLGMPQVALNLENGMGGALPEVNIFKSEPAAEAAIPHSDLLAKFQLPLWGRLSSPYGYRVHPVSGSIGQHTGTDIAAPYGTAIGAVYDGVVKEVGKNKTYGNYVIVDHGEGVETMYGHCSKLLVKKGAKVAGGTTIAKVGSTGLSTGNHLHLEVRVDGERVDPVKAIPALSALGA